MKTQAEIQDKIDELEKLMDQDNNELTANAIISLTWVLSEGQLDDVFITKMANRLR